MLDNIRLETLESDDIVNSSAFNGLSMRETAKPLNDKLDQTSDASSTTNKRSHDINDMLRKGIFRQKQGLVMESRQTKFYYDNSETT